LLDRVVLMTGGAFTARARQFLTEVDTPLIEKPFHPGQLHAMVNAVEHRHAQPDSLGAPPEDELWRPYTVPPGKGL
jgi:hypothetical protein